MLFEGEIERIRLHDVGDRLERKVVIVWRKI